MKTLGNASRFYPPRTLGNGGQLNVAYKDLANIFTAAQQISLATAGTVFTLTSTEAGSSSGPNAVLFRDSATPAASDNLGAIEFHGRDSGTNETTYSYIHGFLDDPTNLSEDGSIVMRALLSGVDTLVAKFGPGGVAIGSNTVPSAAGSINATVLRINNIATRQIAQIVTATNVTYQTCPTDLPLDNSIPQNTEGDEILSSGSFTPLNASSTLAIEISCFVGVTSASSVGLALFSSASANAIDARAARIEGSTSYASVSFTTYVSAASTAARTYTARLGPEVGGAASARLNGDGSGRVFGGIATATITVTEYLP